MDNILRNWKTSGAALVGAVVAILVIFFPSQTEAINQVGQAVVVLCGALIGLFSKDSDKSGTSGNPNP
jgi:peptidoglycan/LPS O-acetylase OafA/YrhL